MFQKSRHKLKLHRKGIKKLFKARNLKKDK